MDGDSEDEMDRFSREYQNGMNLTRTPRRQPAEDEESDKEYEYDGLDESHEERELLGNEENYSQFTCIFCMEGKKVYVDGKFKTYRPLPQEGLDYIMDAISTSRVNGLKSDPTYMGIANFFNTTLLRQLNVNLDESDEMEYQRITALDVKTHFETHLITPENIVHECLDTCNKIMRDMLSSDILFKIHKTKKTARGVKPKKKVIGLHHDKLALWMGKKLDCAKILMGNSRASVIAKDQKL